MIQWAATAAPAAPGSIQTSTAGIIVTEAAIRIQDLTKFYGPHRGIEGLDLEIQRGEVFGFLGPNGAGKTTTIRLLLDLLRPTRGGASILGLDCRRDSKRVRRRIGYLPSEFTLYENLAGRQLLSFLGALRGGTDWSRVESLAGRLGCDLDRPIRALSHGNKQKLAVIQTFMDRAPILILDEPTTGLDPLVQQEFFGLLDEARRSGGTVFLSSHNLSEVEKVCDRVASVREGRLAAVDEIAALRHRALRIVEIVCERSPARSVFEELAGLSEVSVEGRVLRCRVQGSLGKLVAAATPYGIVDILSREPGLEELFLALYGGREGGRAG